MRNAILKRISKVVVKTIFISSPQKEFAAERQALKAYLQGDPLFRRFFNVFLFEDLPASDRRPDDVYLEEVDRCGIYLGLFGNDYGPEDAVGLSATEKEFDRATERAKHRLIYVRGTKAAIRHPKMQALIIKADAQLIRRRFGTLPELTAALYASLVEYLEQKGDLRTGPFDTSACPKAKLNDLSEERLRWFLRTARQERQFALAENTPMIQALEHLNLLDRGAPSHAAILLFGKAPQRFLISSEVKCMHFHDTEIRKPIPSYQIFKGTIFELVDQAVDFIMSKIARSVGTRAMGPQAPVEYELPEGAVAEAIVNAVAHRDYASKASVQAMLFSDRLEVWNPGELPPPLTPEKLRHPHASIPHNPLVADPLFLAHYIEKAGSGTLDMIGLCREAGQREPEFRQDGGQFVQTLWRPKTSPRPAQDQPKTGPRPLQDQPKGLEQRILASLISGPQSALEISKDLKQTPAAGQFKKALRNLLRQGALKYTIPAKPRSKWQRYCLSKKGQRLVADTQTINESPRKLL